VIRADNVAVTYENGEMCSEWNDWVEVRFLSRPSFGDLDPGSPNSSHGRVINDCGIIIANVKFSRVYTLAQSQAVVTQT
jgi:hypothetical protein